MLKEDRIILKKKIKASIVQTKLKIEQLEDATKPISPENSLGRITRMDAINNKSVAEAALRSAKKKLSSLEIAQVKIDDDNFGNCTRCGNAIQAARLMYMPQSSRCINCADKS